MRPRANKLHNCKITKLQNRSRGYILLTLMLFLALLAIAALAVLPDIAFQVKRDREEELIHRAVAYSRGIRRYYKKFGRYPNRIEELDNTNNLRFIRKRYKDPVNNQDFKILRWGDPRLVGLMLGQVPGPGVKGPPGPGATTPSTGGTQVTNTDAGNPPATADTSSSTQQVIGGGPILGVVSASTAQTIREFNNKNHYNDWLFIYDPTSDRGGLLNGPVQPNLNRGLVNNPPPPPPGGTPPTPNPPNPGNQVPPMQ